MAQSSSPVSGIAERYAGSLYELAFQTGAVEQAETDLARFEGMLAESADLERMIKSPVFSAEEQLKAVAAIADKAGIAGLVGNFLRVVAQNRRLFAIPAMIKAFRAIAADARGEVAAEVTSAHPLSASQHDELKAALKSVTGKDVAIAATVDPSLLGGLVVKIGSRQIDTSLKTKLNSLKLALKEVG
ncbi:MAG: F0F1 ATP synthase subunit delta [Hyphomicrobiales bacterium]|nr:F0F1 ATP synthase subunit delta [Hyphomicrobiales bacterium]